MKIFKWNIISDEDLLAELVDEFCQGDEIGFRAGIKELVGPDGYWDGNKRYCTGTGQWLGNIHDSSDDCRIYGCVIHHPSDHCMRSLRTHWRGDRGIMERICAHETGHPDPDDNNYIRRTRGHEAANIESIHGCCGCCHPKEAA